METLVNLLNECSFVVKMVLFFLVLFLSLSCFLLLRRSLLVLMGKRHQEAFLEIEEDLLLYISDSVILPSVKRKYQNPILREHLVKMAFDLNGPEKDRLIELYQGFGFYQKDVHELLYGSKMQKSHALRRARALGITLKDSEWLILFKESSAVFRWASMEYLISIKKSKALPWMFSFLTDFRNDRSGMIQHLLCCFAKISRRDVLVIMDYSESPLVIEQCLRTFSVYPYMKAENSIIAQLNKDTPEECYISSVKALGKTVNSRVLEVFFLLKNHKHWVVRMIMAQSLININNQKAFDLLEHFAEDANYYVRLSALKSLIKVSYDSKEILDKISSDKDHPGNQLLTSLLGVELQKRILL